MAEREGLLSLRVVTMVSKAAPGVPSPAEAGGFVSGFGDSRLKLGGIKIVQDGSNQGFTGYFTEPYHTPFNGDAEWRGYPARSREDLTAMVGELHRAGYQIAIHGNGDAAIDDIIHAFREAQRDFPREDTRHRIEHCQMVRKDQLDEIAELGITPSFLRRARLLLGRPAPGHLHGAGARGRDQPPQVVDRPGHPLHRARRHPGDSGGPAAAHLGVGKPADAKRSGAGARGEGFGRWRRCGP